MNDSVFSESIIILLAHDHNGAVGVVVNKNSGAVDLDAVRKKYVIKKRLFMRTKTIPVGYGGPVEEKSLFVLSSNEKKGKIFTSDFKLTLFTNAEIYVADYLNGLNKNDFLIIRGYCSWASGQLEDEIFENSWIVTEPDYKIIFSAKNESKYLRIAKKNKLSKLSNIVSYTGNA
ncbi:MAG: YqgE/AlgH family protein [Rickettsiales bacterium]